jgi:hypothetical protein
VLSASRALERLPGTDLIKHLLWALTLFIVASLAVACRPRVVQVGVLQGEVNIGPLVPAIREGQSEPTPSPEMYAARQIVIYAAAGGKEIQRVPIDATGNYRVELPVGAYIIDINRIGIDSADRLPTQVEIKSGETVILDVSIETGLR